jgi:cytochrome c oxidase subunit 2
MADGTGPGRITPSGVALGALLAVLIIVSLWLFIAQPWWFPTLASIHGAEVDSVFMAVLIATGVAFVATQGLLGYFVARYGSQGKERAGYWHDNPKAEAILLILTAVVLVVLVFMGQKAWYNFFFTDMPTDAVTVEVTAQQFAWNIHYPGKDGVFGRTDPNLISGATQNFIGLDENDPASKDDIVTQNEMHIPVNRPVIVKLKSKDVIHSFFLPNLRVKQDAVPGMHIQIWFTPNVAGAYDIACAELCGLQHYKMQGFLTVDNSEEEFNNWLNMKLAERSAD